MCVALSALDKANTNLLVQYVVVGDSFGTSPVRYQTTIDPKVKIKTIKTKVKVKLQKISLLKAHTPIVLVLLCHLPAPQARSEDLLLAQP